MPRRSWFKCSFKCFIITWRKLKEHHYDQQRTSRVDLPLLYVCLENEREWNYLASYLDYVIVDWERLSIGMMIYVLRLVVLMDNSDNLFVDHFLSNNRWWIYPLNCLNSVMSRISDREEICPKENIEIVLNYSLRKHHSPMMSMGMLYQDLDYQLHEYIQLRHHELWSRFQYDRLIVEIPNRWQRYSIEWSKRCLTCM